MELKTGASIFIVDDDSDDREFIINALHKNGFKGKIVEFDNGRALEHHLKSHLDSLPDLILLDLNMPVMNGFETLLALKENSFLAHVPVVVLSASSRIEDKEICLQSGCRNFLTKPLDLAGYAKIAAFVDGEFFRS
jgi:CheY-like chemotaxis protein